MNILKEIITHKKQEVAARKRRLSLSKIQALAGAYRVTRRSFSKALGKKPLALIAEVKLKSPSRGALSDAKPESLAKLYAKSEAAALSVLTDKRFFNGSLETLMKVRALCPQPVLRKDFLIDPYQVYESYLAGADALLLIVAALPQKKLKELLRLTEQLGMEALVEVHSKREFVQAHKAGARIIGINNRDLKTLKIDLQVTEKLMEGARKGVLYVSESGIESKADALRVRRAGAHAILVGTSLVTAKNPRAKIKELMLHS